MARGCASAERREYASGPSACPVRAGRGGVRRPTRAWWNVPTWKS